MTKYKLEICNAVDCKAVETVEYEEQIQDEAKAKSYKMLLINAQHYTDGEYTGSLYRKNALSGWQQVSSPVISCVVANKKAMLTVTRVRYGRENGLIHEMQSLCLALQHEQQLFLGNPYTSKGPDDADSIFVKVEQDLDILFSDYRPEYLDVVLLADMKSKIEDVRKTIRSSYVSYGHSGPVDIYTSTCASEIGNVMVFLLAFLAKVQQ